MTLILKRLTGIHGVLHLQSKRPLLEPVHKENAERKVSDCFLYQHVNKQTCACIDHEPHILDLLLSNDDGMISDIEYCSPLDFNFIC